MLFRSNGTELAPRYCKTAVPFIYHIATLPADVSRHRMSFRLSPLKSPVSWIDHCPGTLETNDRRSAPLCYKKKDALETASAFSFEVITVSETQDQIEMLVGAAHGLRRQQL